MSEKQEAAEPHCPECKVSTYENLVATVKELKQDQIAYGLALDLVIISCKHCGHVYEILRSRIS